MTTSVIGLSIDCADPVVLARFWSEVLGRPVNPGGDAENAAIDATDPASGPRLAFHKVPEPKTVKNRLHLDVAPELGEDHAAAVAALRAAGAVPADVGQGPQVSWVVLADPEGSEFCVLSPR